MDARFFGPMLAEERVADLTDEAAVWRAAATAEPSAARPRAQVARTLVAVALRLWAAVMDGWTRRDDDGPAWWEFDAPRGVFC